MAHQQEQPVAADALSDADESFDFDESGDESREDAVVATKANSWREKVERHLAEYKDLKVRFTELQTKYDELSKAHGDVETKCAQLVTTNRSLCRQIADVKSRLEEEQTEHSIALKESRLLRTTVQRLQKDSAELARVEAAMKSIEDDMETTPVGAATNVQDGGRKRAAERNIVEVLPKVPRPDLLDGVGDASIKWTSIPIDAQNHFTWSFEQLQRFPDGVENFCSSRDKGVVALFNTKKHVQCFERGADRLYSLKATLVPKSAKRFEVKNLECSRLVVCVTLLTDDNELLFEFVDPKKAIPVYHLNTRDENASVRLLEDFFVYYLAYKFEVYQLEKTTLDYTVGYVSTEHKYGKKEKKPVPIEHDRHGTSGQGLVFYGLPTRGGEFLHLYSYEVAAKHFIHYHDTIRAGQLVADDTASKVAVLCKDSILRMYTIAQRSAVEQFGHPVSNVLASTLRIVYGAIFYVGTCTRRLFQIDAEGIKSFEVETPITDFTVFRDADDKVAVVVLLASGEWKRAQFSIVVAEE